MFLKIHRIFKF